MAYLIFYQKEVIYDVPGLLYVIPLEKANKTAGIESKITLKASDLIDETFLAISLLTIIAFVCTIPVSCCSFFKKKRCCPNFCFCLYVLFILSLIGIFVIFGVGSVWLKNNLKGFLENTCARIERNATDLSTTELKIYKADTKIHKLLSAHMCTTYCPCYSSEANKLGYDKID